MYCITEISALFSLVIGLGTIGVGEGGQGGNRPFILWLSKTKKQFLFTRGGGLEDVLGLEDSF